LPNALYFSAKDESALDVAESARRSFAELVELHSQLAFRVALAVTRNRQDAEDAVQESFLQLYRGGQWDQIEDQRGYMARVAWRMAVRRRKPQSAEQELDPQMGTTSANHEESAMDREQEAWLHAAIDRLPEKLRQPLALAALGS
jgi:RNA polymerase sigma-70 factor (ECF subfamily)